MALAEQGASVAVTDLKAELTQETVAQIEGETLALGLDVTDIASVDDTIGSVLSQWGALDILVNNAGGGAPPGAEPRENSDDPWDFAFAMNVKSAVHCCEAVIPHMKERRYGKIINIGFDWSARLLLEERPVLCEQSGGAALHEGACEGAGAL